MSENRPDPVQGNPLVAMFDEDENFIGWVRWEQAKEGRTWYTPRPDHWFHPDKDEGRFYRDE